MWETPERSAMIQRRSSTMAIMHRPYQVCGTPSASVNGRAEPSTTVSIVLLSNRSISASTRSSARSTVPGQRCHGLTHLCVPPGPVGGSPRNGASIDHGCPLTA